MQHASEHASTGSPSPALIFCVASVLNTRSAVIRGDARQGRCNSPHDDEGPRWSVGLFLMMCAHACHSVALTVVHSSLFHPSSCDDVRVRMLDGSMLVETSISMAPHPLALRVFSPAGCAIMPLHSAQSQSSCRYLHSFFIPLSWLTIQITFRLIQQCYSIG